MARDDEMAATLRALARDVERCSAREAAQKTREIKRFVVAEVRARGASEDVARPLAAWAAAVATSLRHVLQLAREDARRRDALLQECAQLAEDTALTAYHVLRERTATVAALAPDASADADAARLRGAFARVLGATAAVSARAGAAWVELALLLAVCWVADRSGDPASAGASPAHRATELLEVIVAQCRAHKALARHAAWPLFAQGLVLAVAQRDEPRGLQCLREAETVLADDNQGDDAQRGALCYWLAVLLSRAGQHAAAVEQLRGAVVRNYHAVAALNLQALLALQRGDLHEASLALERSVGVDVGSGGTASLFNYAVLLERMGNYDAQYQMLEYYEEAAAEREIAANGENHEMNGGDEAATTKRAKKAGVAPCDGLACFDERETARLFSCARRAVERGDVALRMAMAATASGTWHDARECFEEYFDAVSDGPSIYETARRTYIYVLLQCNRPTEALAECVRSQEQESDLWVAFYKADALLCLERVDECEAQLRHVIEPQLAHRLATANDDNGELVGLHVQLLNNLAVAVVCRGDVDAAVALLRDCTRHYASRTELVLPVQFNLTLLLWRLERREAASALWFETRGWRLRMDVGDMREQQRALSMVALVEDEALCAASSHTGPAMTSHVSDSASGTVDAQQLRNLDALVLSHWGAAQDALVAKTAAQYVEYLEALSAKSSTH